VTLLQTVFSGDRIIQVSDPRLNLNGALFDDAYTKLVCWNQTFAAGFTASLALTGAPGSRRRRVSVQANLCA